MTVTDKECADLNAIIIDNHTTGAIETYAKVLDYEVIEVIGDPSKPGFLGVAFKKIGENVVVLAHRGTDPSWCNPFNGLLQLSHCPKVVGTDLSDDILISLGNLPEQLPKSEKLLELTRAKFGLAEVVISGYSLGGVYAELVGLNHNLRVVSFDSPGVREQAIKYVGAETLEQNKHKVTVYKSSPNIINTSGEHYTDIVMTEFLTPFSGTGLMSYWGYTFRQHDIRLIAENLGAGTKLKEWPKGLWQGYIRYLSSEENNLHWNEHVKGIWEGKKPDIVLLTPEEAVFEDMKASFTKYYKTKFLDKRPTEEEVRQEERILHDKLKVMYDYKRQSAKPVEYSTGQSCAREEIAFGEFLKSAEGIKHREQPSDKDAIPVELSRDPRISRDLYSKCKPKPDIYSKNFSTLELEPYKKRFADAEEKILSLLANQGELQDALITCAVGSCMPELLRIGEILIRCGVPVNTEDAAGSPLFLAASSGSHEMMRLLILNGAEYRVVDSRNYTILHYAVLGGKKQNILCALSAGVDHNVVCDDGWTALVFAQKMYGYEEVAEFLEYNLSHLGDVPSIFS